MVLSYPDTTKTQNTEPETCPDKLNIVGSFVAYKASMELCGLGITGYGHSVKRKIHLTDVLLKGFRI